MARNCAEQLVVCEPATPPSPLENKMEVPRAPSCMYALQSDLKLGEFLLPARRQDNVLGNTRRDLVLVGTVARSKNMGRVVHAQEVLDDVLESAYTVAVVPANGDKGYPTRHQPIVFA